MNSLSILSLTILFGSISAEVAENCVELELYDKQVSDKEITRPFGPYGYEEVNGPIPALFCQGGKNCSKLKLQAFLPDLPIEGDQTVTKSGAWTSFFSKGKKTCENDEIVTGVECKDKNCGSVRLKCSPLNSKVYKRSNSSKPSTESASSSSIRSRCAKGTYMVGMECKGRYCSEIRLECAKIEYKNRKEDCTGGLTSPTPAPTPICKNKTMSNGQPWSDRDHHQCYDYSKLKWCSKYGGINDYRNIYVASEACCECGGGDWN